MHTGKRKTEAEQVHHLAENLISQLARGREWATPGVQAALQKAVAGLDSGIETASPRLQALLRRLAEELAGGVETLTPQVQERLRRVGPKAYARVAEPNPVQDQRPASRMWWWTTGVALAATGAAVWRSMQASKEEPAASPSAQERGRTDPDADPDLTAGRI